MLKYEKDLNRFIELTSKKYISQITREDIIAHVNKLMDGGMVAQTSHTTDRLRAYVEQFSDLFDRHRSCA